MKISLALHQLGLSSKEADTYTALLRTGQARASEIAAKTKQQREAIYYTLKLLKQKGLVSETIRSGVKHYSACEPDRLIEIINEQRREQIEAIKDILPELQAMQQTAVSHARTETYSGIEGLKSVLAKITQNNDVEVLAMIGTTILDVLPKTYNEQFRRKRTENNIYMRAIAANIPKYQELQRQDQQQNREIRFNELLHKTTTITYILPQAYVLIKANQTEQIAIYIEDAELAELQRTIFETLWEQSE